ncbi:MAG: succinate--CoA ligase subunit alpha [Nitrososphaeria archaeon]|nr:succinate--CoA ligase subunit alpha [Nitrososphaeria archaeon]NIN51627.1 succinate--CoA ligase subunit alpha [Nitrososphaeria archaeon]NIQ32112.1 succinate--CoA ligase subunit alpha [Nitrososphaeria archaeon]
MSILVNKDTRVVVQGITGREGSLHTELMKKYGTEIVAGVTPGKGGTEEQGVPVYDSVLEAVEAHVEANSSIIFVPAQYAADAVYEAVEANLCPIVVITEFIPIWDSVKFISYARERGIKIIGPNCPGVITPGECKLGVMPAQVYRKGSVGIVSRSGTLTYEISAAISRMGLGQSTCVGIGGDPVTGMDTVEVIEMFEEDTETEAIAVIGEIGGDAEERLAHHIKEQGIIKPIVAFVAGRTAPPGKRMGHAGAIVSKGLGTAEGKIKALRKANVHVADTPSGIAEALLRLL